MEWLKPIRGGTYFASRGASKNPSHSDLEYKLPPVKHICRHGICNRGVNDLGSNKCDGILLRVGLDGPDGGIFGPVFNNKEFEFIPVPDDLSLTNIHSTEPYRHAREKLLQAGIKINTYGDTSTRHNHKKLSDLLPDDILTVQTTKEKYRICNPSQCIAHLDPDFDNRSYGDYWKSNNGGKFPIRKWADTGVLNDDLTLTRTVHVFFVASLWSAPDHYYGRDEPRQFSSMRKDQRSQELNVYLVGYFEVDRIIDVNKHMRGWQHRGEFNFDNEKSKQAVLNNFHYKRYQLTKELNMENLDDEVVILIGRKKTQLPALLPTPLKLKENHIISKPTNLGKKLGVNTKGDVVRGLRCLSHAQCEEAVKLIDNELQKLGH